MSGNSYHDFQTYRKIIGNGGLEGDFNGFMSKTLSDKDARIRVLEAENERLRAEIGRLIDCGQSIYLALPIHKNGEPKWITHAREQSFSCSQQQYPPELPYSINRKTQAGQEAKP